jgi:hypothetical protein
MKAEKGSIAGNIQDAYAEWFRELQALTTMKLNAEWYTGRWYDGLTPAEALFVGPDEELPFGQPAVH